MDLSSVSELAAVADNPPVGSPMSAVASVGAGQVCDDAPAAAGEPMDRRAEVPLRVRLVLVDVVLVVGSWLGPQLAWGSGAVAERLVAAGAGALATLAAVRVLGLYRSRLCARKADVLVRLIFANGCGAGVLVWVQLSWSGRVDGEGARAVACAAVCTAAWVAGRWLFGRHLRKERARGRYQRNVLLVGWKEEGRALCTMLRSEPELGYVVAGIIGGTPEGPGPGSVPWCSSIVAIPELARSTGASGILVVPSALSSEATRRAIEVAMDATLHVQVWSGLQGIGSSRLRSMSIAHEPFFYVERRSASSHLLLAKRVIDVVVASVALVLAVPLLTLAALLIKLEDRGPVFHTAMRVGQQGKEFRVVKLRSMATNARLSPALVAQLNERVDGPLFKASKDPRVTRVGRLLRLSSVDELPQLWNVLRGTMSLVGPRPALPDEVEQFDEELRRRHSFRPGMTGLWQVEARHNPSFNAYRRLDLHYVDNWSLWLDLSILAATVPAVLGQAFGRVWEVRRRHERVAPGQAAATSVVGSRSRTDPWVATSDRRPALTDQ